MKRIPFPVGWGLVVLLHLLAAAWQYRAGGWYLVDSHEYVWAARNLLSEGRLYSADPAAPFRADHLTKRPPVYPLLLMLTYLPTGSALLVGLLQTVLGLVSLALSRRILLRWSPSARVQRLWWVLAVVYPAQYLYAQWLMSELLLQALLLGLCWLLLESSQRVRAYAGAALLLVLAFLTKPVMYLFVLPFAALGGWWAWRRRDARYLLPALLPLLAVLLYGSWNAQRTGWFHISSIQNLSLLQYSTYHFLLHTQGPEAALRLTDEIWYAALGSEDFASGQRLIQSRCTAILLSEPLVYAGFHAKGMINFFLDPGRFDLYAFFQLQLPGEGGPGLTAAFAEAGYAGVWQYLRRQPLHLLALLGLLFALNVFKLTGLLRFVLLRRVPPEARLLVVLLIGYLAVLTGPSGASRFMVPVFPLLVVAAAWGWGNDLGLSGRRFSMPGSNRAHQG
ncbi:MAG: hypothetical protein OHK0039_30050 [Bacteroidia bacterium]